MMILQIRGWDKSRAWTDDVAHVRGILVRMLRESSPLSHVQAKRLVRAILAGAETDLPLHDPYLIQAIRHALQSIGADVRLIPPST